MFQVSNDRKFVCPPHHNDRWQLRHHPIVNPHSEVIQVYFRLHTQSIHKVTINGKLYFMAMLSSAKC